MQEWSAPATEHETTRVSVAPAESWNSGGALRCALCARAFRDGAPVLAVETDVDSVLVWSRHAHLLPSQCVAGGALALGSLEADTPCDVCGEMMRGESLACAVRPAADGSSEDGPTMHLKCACRVAGQDFRAAEAATQREMPKPHSQVMGVVGFDSLQDSEKCIVAVALGGWNSGAGYFAPRSPTGARAAAGEPRELELQAEEPPDEREHEDGNISDESVELVAVSTQEHRSRAAQDAAIDLSQGDDDSQVDSTPRQDEDEQYEQNEQAAAAAGAGGYSSGTSAQRPSRTAPASAAAASAPRPRLERNVRRSPAATPASSPKRARTDAFDAPKPQPKPQPQPQPQQPGAGGQAPPLLVHKLQGKRLNIVGHFGDRIKYGPGVKAPKAGDELHAVRDHTNEHDKNAIAVHRDSKQDPNQSMVGFLPRDVAKLVARYLDQGELQVIGIRVGLLGASRSGKIDSYLRMSCASEELQELIDVRMEQLLMMQTS